MSEDLKIKRQRSPNFPAEPLEKCIEISKKIFDKYKKSPVAQIVVAKGLGFSPTSGGALQLFAALSSYGLIDASGSGQARTVKLSDDAYKIIMDTRAYSPDRDGLIMTAALRPAIFSKIREENPDGLPAEDALAHDLKLKYGFNPNSVHGFINILTKTFEFAKVYESDIIPDENTDYHRQELINEKDNVMLQPERTPQTSPHHRQLKPVMPTIAFEPGREIAKFIVGQGKTISLIADGTITQKSIQKLIKMLEMNVEDFPVNEEGLEPSDITH